MHEQWIPGTPLRFFFLFFFFVRQGTRLGGVGVCMGRGVQGVGGLGVWDLGAEGLSVLGILV